MKRCSIFCIAWKTKMKQSKKNKTSKICSFSSIMEEELKTLKSLFQNKDAARVEQTIQMFEKYPENLKSIYYLVRDCRKESQHQFGFFLCTHLLSKLSKNDPLFPKVLYELSILAFYCSELVLGLEACDNFILYYSLQHPELVQSTYTNLQYYLQPLSCKILVTHHLPNISIGWNACNPGLCLLDNKLIINIRLVNSGCTWEYINPILGGHKVDYDHPIITENVRAELCFTNDGHIILDNQYQLSDVYQSLPRYRNYVKGLEDCKLFVHEDDVWFLATGREFSPTDKCQMIIGNEQYATILKSPDVNRHEKNWSPFSWKHQILVIYQFAPFQIFNIDPVSGDFTIIHHKLYEDNLSYLRGSSPPFYYKQHFYFIVHEVIYHPKRVYYHRVIQMNGEFELLKMSRPFTLLQEHKIEYVNGLVIDKDTVFITWGNNDSNAMLSTIKFEDFKQLLVLDIK